MEDERGDEQGEEPRAHSAGGGFLQHFVSARFWLVPAYAALYYIQLVLLKDLPVVRQIVLIILLMVSVLAVPANVMWIVDYRGRLVSGINYLIGQRTLPTLEKQLLEQIRWSNAKILGVTALILAVLAHHDKLALVPAEHQAPLLAVVLIIIVALFDSTLDLEAEWTVSVMLSVRMEDTEKQVGGTLARTIWRTNQFRPSHLKLFEQVRNEEPVKDIAFSAFSATAQNLISFAVIIVSYVAVRMTLLLWQQLPYVFSVSASGD